MHKVGFIVHGDKRRKNRFLKELEELTNVKKGFSFSVRVTEGPGHGRSLAQELVDSGHTHIIAVGGDGILNETINGMMQAKSECIVGSLSYGTANDFSKSINSPNSLVDILHAIEKDKRIRLDVGLIESAGSEGRYFINIASIGLGAEVVTKVNDSKKLLGADITFFWAILKTFLRYRNQPIRCITRQWRWEGNIKSMAIANGKFFGNGLCIAPEANLTDGIFSVAIIGEVSIIDYLRNLSKIKRGEKIDHPNVKYRTARFLEVDSSSTLCKVEVDGELLGALPITVSILPKAVWMIGEGEPTLGE